MTKKAVFVKKKAVLILGGGSWGITLYSLLKKKGYSPFVLEASAERIEYIRKKKKHDLLDWIPLRETSFISSSFPSAVPDTVVITLPSQCLRAVLLEMKKHYGGKKYDFIIASKGIEISTGKLLSEVITDVYGKDAHKRILVLSGPSHAEEVSRKIPTAVVLGGSDGMRTNAYQKIFSNEYFRVYAGTKDIRGIQLGGALKNIIAVACGISDGLGLGDNTRAAIMTRGMAEIVRYGVQNGAWQSTFYGLSGMGDLCVTCGSKHSRNWQFGYRLGRGMKPAPALRDVGMVVEGYYTVLAMHKKLQKKGIEMPITEILYRILYESLPAKKAIAELMTRKLKREGL